MIIKITNPITKASASFYENKEWMAKYGRCGSAVEPAVKDNAYQIMREGGFGGLFELPHNNSIRSGGLDQDGTDQLNNYYSDRNITFTFKMVHASNLIELTSVLYQDNHLLEVEIINEGRHFYTTGSLNGTYNGVIDMDCHPWFNTGTRGSLNHTYVFNNGVKPFFPFKVNDVYFRTDGIDYSTFTVNSYFKVDPIITLKGNLDNITLFNKTDGSFIKIKGVYKEIKIDTENRDLFGDGVSIIDDMVGVLPALYAGETIFKIQPRKLTGDIKVSVEYLEIVGCIF